MTVYLNGKFVDRGDAVVSVDDRGFVFGDGVYEVTRSRDGVLLEVDRHVRRLERSLAGLDLAYSPADLPAISSRLLRDNGLARGEATVYWQVTRGAASPRTHQFPPVDTPVTVYASASIFTPLHDKRASGVGTILVPDQRWARCDLKTVNLLPNVLAKQKAVAAGMHEAILMRDGVIMEGAATNFFGVIDGVVRTHPTSNYILPGITRAVVLELANELGLAVREEPMFVDDIPRLSESFLTGTTNDVMPVVAIDGRPVGDGRPGPIAGRLYSALIARWRVGD
ncbi:MAG TPA: aminotransferase class IV [Gemmatimonadaceae bacterium]|jgi:D-alanine transaminase|nr:aminotransferase class IV [Gemmatimonadaceae bacterium]